MIEGKADLFERIFDKDVDAICIATNGWHLEDGTAAMGGGQAEVCVKKWPRTAIRLGTCLKNFGTNIPFIIGAIDNQFNYLEPTLKIIKDKKFKSLIFSFPTMDGIIEGAKLELIENSAKELKAMVERYELKKVVLGRPGCGIGGLLWENVKPILEQYFDDRFLIVSFLHES